MKAIAEIRPDLRQIPGVFYEREPEETERGTERAVRTLWARDQQTDARAPINQAPVDENLESEETVGSELDELFEIAADIDDERLQQALGGGLEEQIRKSIELRGVDALGWYVTFHAIGVQWGIYVKASSVLYLSRIFDHVAPDMETRFRMAFRAIHQHELFHFATDYMSAQWELITGRPCHRLSRALRDGEAGYIILEEALANANMIRSFRRGRLQLRKRGCSPALQEFTLLQPKGYRDASRYKSTAVFVKGCEQLARNYIGCIPDYGRGGIMSLDVMGLYPEWPRLDWRYCPGHVVDDTPSLKLPPFRVDLFRTVEGIEESPNFLSSLDRASRRIQRAWKKAKQQLAIDTATRGLDFKAWERRSDRVVYSVRLDRNIRAHLERHLGTGQWIAADLGTHTKMGHD